MALTVPGNPSLANSRPVPRFRWPMRLFLGFLLVQIVAPSFLSLYSCTDWMHEKQLARYPKPLTSIEEWRQLAEEDPALACERIWETLDSFWDYWHPWPNKESRAHFS